MSTMKYETLSGGEKIRRIRHLEIGGGCLDTSRTRNLRR
jgi:hypothetical protein